MQLNPRRKTGCLFAFALLILSACGGSGSSVDTMTTHSLQTSSVTGALEEETTLTGLMIDLFTPTSVQADIPTMLYLDDSSSPIMVGTNGEFTIKDIADGDHSLYWNTDNTDHPYEFQFRMSGGLGLDFGTIAFRDGLVESFSGFNGYRFGYIDEDGDGVNDNFTDANGDGICDQGRRYAGYSYMQELGFVDEDGDGVNDLFVDADGDGINDLTEHVYGRGFGFIDEDGDGINDHFRDVDGDWICYISGVTFSHGFGFVDENGDGVNDRFVDSDGDGVNDIGRRPYTAMPGWVDLDNDGVNDYFSDTNGDGVNDRFVDADGDGINDLIPLGYGHGFGFIDEDGDGVNDRFVDENGDGINDVSGGMPYRFGHFGRYVDANGDGIDDQTNYAYRQCFGWVDSDADGFNDVFTDENGDAVNDITSEAFGEGFLGMGMSRLDRNYQWPRGSRWGRM